MTKRGVIKSEHVIMYTGRVAPEPLEAERTTCTVDGLRVETVRAVGDSRGEALLHMSRLNLGKVYTIEHNIKVKSFGMVHENSMGALETA